MNGSPMYKYMRDIKETSHLWVLELKKVLPIRANKEKPKQNNNGTGVNSYFSSSGSIFSSHPFPSPPHPKKKG